MRNLEITFGKPVVVFILAAILSCAAFSAAQAENDEKELFLVAQKAFEDGFYDVAIRYINQLFEAYPKPEKEIQAKLLLGQCYFFKAQYLKAYDIFQSLIPYTEFKDATIFWLGETYLKGSDHKQAEKQYQQLIELYPESIYVPQAYYALGWSYFAQNKFDQAKDAFRRITRKFPAHQLAEDATFKIAEAEYNLHSYESAIKYFQNYVSSFPQSRRHDQAYFYIGECYYYLKNYLNAVTYYAKTAQIGYDSKLILMAKVSLGWSYLKLEKMQLAQQYFDDAYTYAKTKGILSDDVLLGQATFYAETGKSENAILAYLQLIEKFPKSERIIEAYQGLANTYYQTDSFAKAIATYRKILELSVHKTIPDEILEKTYFGLAWSYLKNGQLDTAVEQFHQIKDKTKSKTVKISALTQIGDAYHDAGQFKKAVEVYDRILRDFADSLYADYVQYRQGIALLKMDQIDAATLSFQSLKTNFPASKYLNDANYYLGVAYFKNENWRTSDEYMQSFIEGLPRSNEFLSEAIYISALCHYNMKKYPEALKIFSKILKEYPGEITMAENAEIYSAKCQYKMGDIPTAIKKFQVLANKTPASKASQEALIWLGDHYLESSTFDKAVFYYQKFIADFPDADQIDAVLYELGRAYQAQEAFSDAINAYKRIDQSRNKELFAKARLAIADIFSKDHDAETSISTYREIIEIAPEFTRDAYIKIAEVHKREGQYAQALSSYQSALAAGSSPGGRPSAELQFLIGDTYELLNETEKAVEEYLKISYLYPDKAYWIIKADLRTARIFEDNEQWDEALIAYKKVLEFKTDESKFAEERIQWINEHSPR